MVAPHKKNRKRVATQDGLRLRRYKHRFKVERFFSWIEDYRRLVVRWEYHAENYLGFVLLACMRMLITAYLINTNPAFLVNSSFVGAGFPR